MKHPRTAIAALSLSASALVGLLAHEGYSDKPIIPVAGDRWTIGFGSTFREDGSPVRPGDRITPPQAVRRSYAHIAKDEAGLKKCVTAPMSQAEYDTLVDFAYQYGVPTACASSIVKFTNEHRYKEACDAYLLYRFVAKRDCSIRSNGCFGVWTRSQERQKKCLDAQP
jgi:GH24 family phage-related lysozyme (muramidase)